MKEYQIICRCGHRRRVNERSVGLSGRCPKCGREVIITDDDLLPLDAKPAAKEPETIVVPRTGFEDDDADMEEAVIDFLAPSKSAPKEPHCERCKRVFRGDWDRIHTPEGLLCNICANMVRQVQMHEVIANPQAGLTPAQLAKLQEELDKPSGPPPPSEDDIEPQEKKWFDIDSERFRSIVLWAGVAVVALAITTVLFDNDPVPSMRDARVTQQVAEEVGPTVKEQLPPVGRGLVYAIMFGGQFAGELAALWITLNWANALPNAGFWKNVVAIGLVALGLTIVWMIPFSIVPGLGFLLGLLRPILVLYFIYQLYQLSLWEMISYMFCHYLVSIIVFFGSTVLYWLVGLIFL